MSAERVCIEVDYRPEDRSRTVELPPDRTGDLIVVSEPNVVRGTAPARHDLSGLDAPLCSHGGISEQAVPLAFNRPTRSIPAKPRWRNFDVFAVALDHFE